MDAKLDLFIFIFLLLAMGSVFKMETQGNAGDSYATTHTPNIHYTKYNMEYCLLAFFLKIPLSSKVRQNLPDAKMLGTAQPGLRKL